MALKLGSPTSERFERILIYGDPKTGKTRLATSLTGRFGDSLYVAADPGADGISSVLTTYQPRLRVISTEYPKNKPHTAIDNPHKDAFLVACQDWVGDGAPKDWLGKTPIRTLIWDTITATSQDILSYVATSGQFSDKAHIGLGQPGGVEHQKLPMQGDYMATHNIISRLVDFLFKQPLHLIVVCHSTYDEAREGGTIEGGPATAGKATVRSFPGRFDTVIHLTRRSTPAPSGGTNNQSISSVTAWTERHGIWSAGIRSGHANNPMPKIDLDSDPVNFWLNYDKFFAITSGCTKPGLPESSTEKVLSE